MAERTRRQYYTPQEVGNLTGFSQSFILREIKLGELRATFVQPPGRVRGRWRIAVEEARAYVVRLGLTQPASS